MSRARVTATALLVLAAGLVLAPLARADSQARIVRLSLVDGPVQIDRATGQGFEKAIVNMPIAQGMKLRTQGNSRAEVEFEDGTAMRLVPGVQVEFADLTLLSSGGRASTVRVNDGTVYFDVRHKGDDDFRVAFADQTLDLRRSVRFRLDLAGSQARIAVFKGELDANEPGGETKVKKNQTLTMDLSGQGRYELAKGISAKSYDSWDAGRSDYESRYASARYGDVPYYYGRGDLNYYGSWGYVPGYGDLWRPFGVGYGWDPFYDGAWAWYPGWGYTWVSTYPWGWIPYRYGTWLWVQNYGWCWRPGNYLTWYTVPAVVGPPPAYRPPQPPSAPGGGTPPTVVVTNGAPFTANPRLRPRTGDGILAPRTPAMTSMSGATVTSTGAAPATAIPSTTTTAPAPTAPRPAAVPARTAIPRSGPGLGRRPEPLDAGGLPRSAGRTMRESGRPVFAGPSPRSAAPAHTSAPAAAPAPRIAAPPAAAPRSSPPPSGSGGRPIPK